MALEQMKKQRKPMYVFLIKLDITFWKLNQISHCNLFIFQNLNLTEGYLETPLWYSNIAN